MPNEFSALLPSVLRIAKEAGSAILSYHKSEMLEVSHKLDNTPLTNADIAAHKIITAELSRLNDWPILSEEGEIPSYEHRQNWSRYWLSDPLDGTRGFIQGLDEFSVNIAIIDHHRPVLGVIYAPVYKTAFFACEGEGAFLQQGDGASQQITTTKQPFNDLRFIVGKYHNLRRIQPVLEAIPHAKLLRLNSSLKFTALACGEADVYARFGPISEWDTAAGHCILNEAGGKVVDFEDQSLQYNAGKSLLCPPFLAVGNQEHIHALIKLFKQGESE